MPGSVEVDPHTLLDVVALQSGFLLLGSSLGRVVWGTMSLAVSQGSDLGFSESANPLCNLGHRVLAVMPQSEIQTSGKAVWTWSRDYSIMPAWLPVIRALHHVIRAMVFAMTDAHDANCLWRFFFL